MKRRFNGGILALSLLAVMGAGAAQFGLYDTLDVYGEITQGATGAVLISAAGDLRDDIVGTAELKLATGSSTGNMSRRVVIPPATFWPQLTGTCNFEGTVADMAGDYAINIVCPFGVWAVEGGGRLLSLSLGTPVGILSDEALPAGVLGENFTQGIATLLGDGWVVVGGGSADEALWRINLSDPDDITGVYGEKPLPPTVSIPVGITAHGGNENLYLLDNGGGGTASIWILDPDDTDSTSGIYGRYLLPPAATFPLGITSDGTDLWVSHRQSNIFRVDPDDIDSTSGDYGLHVIPSNCSNSGQGMAFFDEFPVDYQWPLRLSHQSGGHDR